MWGNEEDEEMEYDFNEKPRSNYTSNSWIRSFLVNLTKLVLICGIAALLAYVSLEIVPDNNGANICFAAGTVVNLSNFGNYLIPNNLVWLSVLQINCTSVSGIASFICDSSCNLRQLVFCDSGCAYVASPSTNTVAVINTDTYKIINSITVGDSPTQIVISPNEQFLYVMYANRHNVSVIDIKLRTVIHTITITAPSFIAITPNGATLYVLSADNNAVHVINTNTYQPIIVVVLTDFTTATGPTYIAFDVNSLTAYIAMYNAETDTFAAGTVVKCDTTTYNCAQITVSPAVNHVLSFMTVAVSSSGHIYTTGFINDDPNNVYFYVINSDGTEVSRLSLDYSKNAESIAISSDGNIAYLPIIEDKVLAIINVTDNSAQYIQFTDSEPHSVKLSSNGAFLYVTTNTNTIIVINTTAPYNTVMHEIGNITTSFDGIVVSNCK